MILVLDFGGQYNQLIVRRIRDLNVYSEIMPFDTPLEVIKQKQPQGIILTGGPRAVTQADAPLVDPALFTLGVPILGICYGMHVIAHMLGGKVTPIDPDGEAVQDASREYGRAQLTVNADHPLFAGLESKTDCWMSHTCAVTELPPSFQVIASTPGCPIAAAASEGKRLYGVQFHPEVVHTPKGNQILHNFIQLCDAAEDWIMEDYAGEMIKRLRSKLTDQKVLCALSGGVDSSVAATLIYRAVGKNLTCIFVDNGLLRLNEADEVEQIFRNKFDLNFIRVDAADQFLTRLSGVTDPESKRKIIGEEFIRVFEAEAQKIGTVDFLVQGTIYPDVIESGSTHSALIKSHHNVGGLPESVNFREIVEPLRDLFKDEVRRVGLALGLPASLVNRQPFPGPGLAVRCLGEVTRDKLQILRLADAIFRDEIAKAGLSERIWQYFAVLPNLRTVGVMGDERTYSHTVALRAVASMDAMTADWFEIPFDVLKIISNRIVNEVTAVNRVVYDITSKPPATIEWE